MLLGVTAAVLDQQEVFLRVGLAVLAGVIVGYERESHGRAAGLRTTMLVCVAACVAMLLSEYLFIDAASASATWRPDPARIAQGILAGMGFLGAGAIIREGNAVRGVTTAAVLWFVTIIGLCLGSGYIMLGMVGLLVAATALFVLPMVERRIQNDWYGEVIVTLGDEGPGPDEVRAAIEAHGAAVKNIDLDHDVAHARRVYRCDVKYKHGNVFTVSQRVIDSLLNLRGVQRVQWS